MAVSSAVDGESSNTRNRLLDAVEAIMIDAGHAAVTYRAVATRAEVVPSNVQYYFPTLDDLLVATVRRRTEQSLAHLVHMLQARPHHPLRVLWEFGSDETTATLAFEFSAMGNHRESVRAETVRYMRQMRDIQMVALSGAGHLDRESTPLPAVLFLLTGIPKMIQMEQDLDIDIGHREITSLVNEYLDTHEPL